MKLSKLVKISEPVLLICKIRKIKVIARPCNHMRCLTECLAQPESGTHSFPTVPLPPFFFTGLFVGFFLFGFLSSFFNFSVPESAFPHTKGCAYCFLIEGIYHSSLPGLPNWEHSLLGVDFRWQKPCKTQFIKNFVYRAQTCNSNISNLMLWVWPSSRHSKQKTLFWWSL